TGSTSTPPAKPDPIDIVGPVLAEIVLGQGPAGPMGIGIGSGPTGVMLPIVTTATGSGPVLTGGSAPTSTPTAGAPPMPSGSAPTSTPTAGTPPMPSGFSPIATAMAMGIDPGIPMSVMSPPKSPPSTGGSTGS